MPLPTTAQLSWSRDNFLVSTSPTLMQPQTIAAAFDSDFMYWTKPMSEAGFTTMLANSLCFSVYEMPTVNHAGPTAHESGSGPQIGLARLVTDRVSFAYLTDVYILPAYQKKGLGTWLLRCVQETLDSWPELRGSLLYADQGKAVEMYGEVMGVKPWVQGTDGLVICTRRFKGTALSIH